MSLLKTLEIRISMPIEDFIIQVYLLVEDFLKDVENFRQSGPAPKLTDGEVITMEIVGEFLGIGSDKGIFDYFKHHWHPWFPELGCRTTVTRQMSNIWNIKKKFQKHILEKICPMNDIFLCAGLPIPTCHPKRVRIKNPFRAEGGFGYCAAKDQRYFGFKGHLLTTQQGLILDFTLAAANIDERDVLPELVVKKYYGTLIADKGLIRPFLTQELMENSIDLQTPLRNNMVDSRPKPFVHKLMNIRRTIETVIGQLVDRFNIQSRAVSSNIFKNNIKVFPFCCHPRQEFSLKFLERFSPI